MTHWEYLGTAIIIAGALALVWALVVGSIFWRDAQVWFDDGSHERHEGDDNNRNGHT